MRTEYFLFVHHTTSVLAKLRTTSVAHYSLTRATLMSPGKDQTRANGYNEMHKNIQPPKLPITITTAPTARARAAIPQRLHPPPAARHPPSPPHPHLQIDHTPPPKTKPQQADKLEKKWNDMSCNTPWMTPRKHD